MIAVAELRFEMPDCSKKTGSRDRRCPVSVSAAVSFSLRAAERDARLGKRKEEGRKGAAACKCQTAGG